MVLTPKLPGQLLLLTCIAAMMIASASGKLAAVCQDKHLNLVCRPGSAVHIHCAVYGPAPRGKCGGHGGHRDTRGCEARRVTHPLGKHCNGLRRCRLTVRQLQVGKLCRRDLGYLKVLYSCDRDQCSRIRREAENLAKEVHPNGRQRLAGARKLNQLWEKLGSIYMNHPQCFKCTGHTAGSYYYDRRHQEYPSRGWRLDLKHSGRLDRNLAFYQNAEGRRYSYFNEPVWWQPKVRRHGNRRNHIRDSEWYRGRRSRENKHYRPTNMNDWRRRDQRKKPGRIFSRHQGRNLPSHYNRPQWPWGEEKEKKKHNQGLKHSKKLRPGRNHERKHAGNTNHARGSHHRRDKNGWWRHRERQYEEWGSKNYNPSKVDKRHRYRTTPHKGHHVRTRYHDEHWNVEGIVHRNRDGRAKRHDDRYWLHSKGRHNVAEGDVSFRRLKNHEKRYLETRREKRLNNQYHHHSENGWWRLREKGHRSHFRSAHNNHVTQRGQRRKLGSERNVKDDWPFKDFWQQQRPKNIKRRNHYEIKFTNVRDHIEARHRHHPIINKKHRPQFDELHFNELNSRHNRQRFYPPIREFNGGSNQLPPRNFQYNRFSLTEHFKEQHHGGNELREGRHRGYERRENRHRGRGHIDERPRNHELGENHLRRRESHNEDGHRIHKRREEHSYRVLELPIDNHRIPKRWEVHKHRFPEPPIKHHHRFLEPLKEHHQIFPDPPIKHHHRFLEPLKEHHQIFPDPPIEHPLRILVSPEEHHREYLSPINPPGFLRHTEPKIQLHPVDLINFPPKVFMVERERERLNRRSRHKRLRHVDSETSQESEEPFAEEVEESTKVFAATNGHLDVQEIKTGD